GMPAVVNCCFKLLEPEPHPPHLPTTSLSSSPTRPNHLEHLLWRTTLGLLSSACSHSFTSSRTPSCSLFLSEQNSIRRFRLQTRTKRIKSFTFLQLMIELHFRTKLCCNRSVGQIKNSLDSIIQGELVKVVVFRNDKGVTVKITLSVGFL